MISLLCGVENSQTLRNSKMVVTRGWGVGGVGKYESCHLMVETRNWQINKFWRSNAQYSEYRQQYRIQNIKVAKGPDLNCFHHKKEMITVWCDRDATMAIISQCKNESSQRVVHLKLTQCYISHVFQFKNV